MRLARVLSVLSLSLLANAAVIQAQTAVASADAYPFYADFSAAATIGHKSSGSFGGEGGARVMHGLDVYAEFGHMKNVGTKDLDDRAAIIANAVGATFSTAYKVNYFDVGVRYHLPQPRPLPLAGTIRPYVNFGVGAAHVRAETALSVNGTTVPPESLGVQFGTDLNGSVNKAFVTFGLGATMPFAKRYFGDLSYRYGRIAARTSEVENDTGINTSRIQLGIGILF